MADIFSSPPAGAKRAEKRLAKRKANTALDEDELLGQPLEVSVSSAKLLRVRRFKKSFNEFLDGNLKAKNKPYTLQGFTLTCYEDAVSPEAPDWDESLIRRFLMYYIKVAKPRNVSRVPSSES